MRTAYGGVKRRSKGNKDAIALEKQHAEVVQRLQALRGELDALATHADVSDV